MGLFGDKLLLRLTASSLPDGELQLQIEKHEEKYRHLLPFSCISLLASQLTVLTEQHPKSLCKRALKFIEFPVQHFEPNALVAGFHIDLYEGRNGILYNQFQPVRSQAQSYINDDRLQTEIEQMLIHYATAIFGQADDREKSLLRAFLLRTVGLYQQEIIPIIQQINVYDAEQRKKLTNTVVLLSTRIYRKWDDPQFIAQQFGAFQEQLTQATQFNAYLL
jgi:hypothetical protein